MRSEKELASLWWKVNKIKERLIIICDWNIKNGREPSEDDSRLLKELVNLIDNSSLPYLENEVPDEQNVIQHALFADELADNK